MRLIDDQGNIFGLFNVIDTLVVLISLAVLVSGAAYVLQPAPESPEVTIEVRVVDESFVIDSIETGPVDRQGIVAVDDVERLGPEVIPENTSMTDPAAADVQVTLEAETRDGLLFYDGERLYIGREIELDLGRTILEGDVVSIVDRDGGSQVSR